MASSITLERGSLPFTITTANLPSSGVTAVWWGEKREIEMD